MKLDRNEIFVWKVFFTPTSDWSLCLLWQDVWCSEYWGLSQVKFPCKEPFMLYRRTIFLNSNPFMELIARKRILNRVNKSSEFQWNLPNSVTSRKSWFRFFTVKKKQCWTTDYFHPYKVYFQGWKSQFPQQEEL